MTEATKIQTVLFDYSGVLTTSLHMPTDNVAFDPDLLFVEMAAALAGTDPHPWHELERGEISLQQFCDYVESRVPGAQSLFAVDGEHNVMDNLTLLDQRLAVAAALKADGLRLGLVTNNVAEWEPFWLPRLPEGLFDVVIDSAAVGCRKPERAIYEIAMQRLGIDDPSTVLFIDDFEWNVAGATAIGMTGLHCTADMNLADALEQLIAVPFTQA